MSASSQESTWLSIGPHSRVLGSSGAGLERTVERGVPLSGATTLGIGGPARCFIDVLSPAAVGDALEMVERFRPARLMVIGQGSNLLPSDSGFDGVVMRVAARGVPRARKLKSGAVWTYGGTSLDALARWSLARGLTGLEWAGGLPGTIGAAVRGNAGAFGHEIGDCVREAEVVSLRSPLGRVEVLDHRSLDFGYRTSRIKFDRYGLVVAVTLQLRPARAGELEAARSRFDQSIAYRQARHPLEYPNCGSVFKNLADPHMIALVLDRWPDIEEQVRTVWHGKVPMGYVIGRLGMAGGRAGQAEISTKHHNFIVNLGGASAYDVRSLISRIRAKVEEAFGFTPEVETEIID